MKPQLKLYGGFFAICALLNLGCNQIKFSGESPIPIAASSKSTEAPAEPAAPLAPVVPAQPEMVIDPGAHIGIKFICETDPKYHFQGVAHANPLDVTVEQMCNFTSAAIKNSILNEKRIYLKDVVAGCPALLEQFKAAGNYTVGFRVTAPAKNSGVLFYVKEGKLVNTQDVFNITVDNNPDDLQGKSMIIDPARCDYKDTIHW